MATIQINRTKTGVVPVSLADGELYIDQLNGKLYWADSTGTVRNTSIMVSAFAASATTDTTNASNITTGQLAAAQGGVPPGAIMPFAMNSAPSGWLAGDGSAVSRTTYSALFAQIGTTWGAGDGSTTFNLPDLRGYFLRGSGTNGDGTVSGSFAAKQADAYLNHSHTITDPGHVHALDYRTGYQNGGGGNTCATLSGPSGQANTYSAVTGITATNASTSGGTETRPKNIAVLYCIKT